MKPSSRGWGPLCVRVQPYNPSVPPAPPPSEFADSLYRGFPDFSAWGPLQTEDADLWSRFASSLEERRKAATPEALRASVDVAIRAAALDSGAIEGLYTVDRGFTMTVAVQGLAWEQMIEERGAEVRELFEAQLAAYEMVLDAVTHKLPITEAWIRTLHETLCAPQETYRVLTAAGWQEHDLPKGQYKTQPNHVQLKGGTVHAYAPVDQVSTEMHRLVEQLRSPTFEAAHPVLQASWVHYAFVAIHPFADGNGRVARALASVYFYRCCSIPLLVFANQRLAYFDSLHAADLGELRPLTGFFRDRGIDTMQLVVENLRTVGAGSPEDLSRRVRDLLARKMPTAKELQNLAFRLVGEVKERLEAQVSQLGLSSQLTLRVAQGTTPVASFNLVGRTADVHGRTGVKVETLDQPAPFQFSIASTRWDDHLDVRLEDVYPELSDTLKLRLDSWVQRQLARMLAEIESGALDT